MCQQHDTILCQRFTIFPGIEYTKEVFVDKEDGQQYAYVLRICKDADVRLDAVMNPGGCKLQEPSVSARLCRREGETLLGVVNADFFHMTNGVPQGAAVVDGKIIKEEMKDKTHFFGIRHDGTYIMGDENTFQENKHKLRIAVSGRDMLVDGDELPEPVLEPKQNRHPRTAVCICENGDLLLVVLDGRNPGVAEGMYLKRFALYLKSLGAHRALNLDGGGSSIMLLRMLGRQEVEVVNSPSDGIERPCANSLAVYTPCKGDGVFRSAHIAPQQEYVAPGTRLQLSAKGLDHLLGACDLPKDIAFSVSEGSGCTVSADGIFEAAQQDCDVTIAVSAAQQVLGTAVLHVRTPDTIHCPNSCIYAENAVHELDVSATLNGCKVLSNGTSYDFDPQQDVGRFDAAGRFCAKSEVCEGDVLVRGKNGGASAAMHVRVGRLPQTIDIAPDDVTTTGCTVGYDWPHSFSPRHGEKVFKIETRSSNAELHFDTDVYKVPKAIGMWVHGIEGELPAFTAAVQNGGKAFPATAFERGEPSDAVWTYMEAPLPVDIGQVQKLKISIMMTGAQGAQFVIDSFRLMYDYVEDDLRIPEFKRIVIRKHAKSGENEIINITAYSGLGDMIPCLAPIDCNRLRIQIDEMECTGLEGYYGINKGASSLMLHNFPVSSGVHRLRVCAQTYDGNQAWTEIDFDTDQLEVIP